MDSLDIFTFDDHTLFLRAWMNASKLSHRQVASRTGQRDGGIVNNLIARRRRFTAELRAAFAPLMELEADELRFLELLVLRDEATSQLEKARTDLERAIERVAQTPSQKSRNSERIAGEAVESAITAIAELTEQIRSARALSRARPLRADALNLLNRWSTVAIGELARCPGFRWNPTWISNRLPGAGSLEEIGTSLQALESFGVLRREGEEGAVHVGAPMAALAQTPRDAMQRWYEVTHERAGEGLKAIFHDRRAWRASRLGATTIALPASALKRAHALVDGLRDELLALSEGQGVEPEEVYQLFVIFFPLTVPHEPG